MQEEKKSNYENVVESWRLRFLEMDHEALISKFGFEADEDAMYTRYFNQKVRIDRHTGEIQFTEHPQWKAGFDTTMMFFNMFHYSIDAPKASGRMVSFREVRRVYPFEAAYKKTIIGRFEEVFAGKTALLEEACIQLGGKPLKQGDVGYQIPIFPFLDLCVLFWDADEEFPAQANMLFDYAINDFVHEENVVCVAADAIYYLEKVAGLDAKEVYGSIE